MLLLLAATHKPRPLPEIKTMELFILFGGAYALYTVGIAIAAHIDYKEASK